uniref:WD40 repeat-like protein n=1 Tax=Mycena chlorophos TaxID=658473 RepID=A0ABQ0M648_MYCCL|nr:predicted protein [Mycena chlorophos]
MVLALATSTSLSLLDTADLRRPPSSIATALALTARPVATAWSKNHLLLASGKLIQAYTDNTLNTIFTAEEAISHMACSQTSLVLASGSKISVVDPDALQLIQSLESHKTPITSLSLNNDVLASTSAAAVHLHDLSSGKQTSLRGLALAGQTISTCTFHPHTPNKLLVAIGRKLVVYDTTRPSAPSKSIPMNDAATGEIVSITCSPFSATLVAVATGGGHVGLVDLNKEQALFRTLNLKVGITCASFSPDGASVYLGTETGKLLVLDLRTLDKAPKSASIGSGARIEVLAVQKKAKAPVAAEPKPSTTSSSRVAPAKNAASLRAPSTTSSNLSPLRKTSALSPRPSVKKPSADSPKVSARQPVSSRPVSSSRSVTTTTRKPSVASTLGVSESISVAARRPSSSSASSVSSVPTFQTAGAKAKSQRVASRTPSPELPSIHALPTPVVVGKAWAPESPERPAEDFVKSKSKAKTVNFETMEEDKENERERSLSMQISPRRPSSAVSAAAGNNWAPSPLRNVVPGSPAGNGAKGTDGRVASRHVEDGS